jgi:hypothetical protein
MSENNTRGVTASDSAVDLAVQAGKRLREAAGKAAAAGPTPVDWSKLLPGDDWGANAGAAMIADEVAEAGKQIGRAYVDAHERAVLIAIEMRERFAAATNTDWVKSIASTQAALEREAANTCFSLARDLLS